MAKIVLGLCRNSSARKNICLCFLSILSEEAYLAALMSAAFLYGEYKLGKAPATASFIEECTVVDARKLHTGYIRAAIYAADMDVLNSSYYAEELRTLSLNEFQDHEDFPFAGALFWAILSKNFTLVDHFLTKMTEADKHPKDFIAQVDFKQGAYTNLLDLARASSSKEIYSLIKFHFDN